MSWIKKINISGWEKFLLAILISSLIVNSFLSPVFWTVGNQVSLFQISIEKIIVALAMTLIIVNGEIDLSVASIMGLAACAFGWLHQQEVGAEWAILIVLLIGILAGGFNAFWITIIGLPSLVVTLAMLVAYRGMARILVKDTSIGKFPEWFTELGQQGLLGPVPFSIILFFVLLIILYIFLQKTRYGRMIYAIGNSAPVAQYSGLPVARVKAGLFIFSGFISALAGLLFAARVGAIRGDVALGFELDIITMVLLGGISIFGGSGTLFGALLAMLIVLNLRNGMALDNITGHLQTGVIGSLLILSVLLPNAKEKLGKILHKSKT